MRDFFILFARTITTIAIKITLQKGSLRRKYLRITIYTLLRTTKLTVPGGTPTKIVWRCVVQNPCPIQYQYDQIKFAIFPTLFMT